MSKLQEFKEQYPQYADVEDSALAVAIHEKYYKDMPYMEFANSVGLEQPKLQYPPSITQKIDNKIKAPKTQLSSINSQGNSSLNQFLTEENPEEKGFWSNAFRRAGERATELGGQALSGIDIVSDYAEESIPLGGFVWDEGSVLPRYANSEEMAQLSKEGKNVLERSSEGLKGMDFDSVPQATWDTVKDTFEKEGVVSGMGEVMAYATETGIASVPDMVAVVANLPAYVFTRSAEIGDERAKNKNKETTDIVDMMEAAPFALGSALLERLGAKGITGVADEIPEEIGKEALKQIAKNAGGAAAKEGGTEFIQEGIIEYVGEKYGTEAKMDIAEALERGVAGMVAGGIYGGAASGGIDAARQGKNVFETNESQLARAIEMEVEGGEFTTSPQEVAAQILDPKGAQIEAETISEYIDQGLPAVVAMSSEEAQEWKTAEDADLDLSTEARMKRAKAMGFDTEKIWYHSSPQELEAFDNSVAGDGAHFFTENKDHADYFTENRRQNTFTGSYYIKTENPMVITQDSLENTLTDEDVDEGVLPRDLVADFVEKAKKEGFDSLIIKGFADVDYVSDVVLPLNENQIRSINAAFAPGTESSSELLASRSAPESKPSQETRSRPTLSMAKPSPEIQFSATQDWNPGTNYAPIIGRHGELPLDQNNSFVLGNGRKVRIPKKPVNRKAVLELFKNRMGLKIFTGRIKRKGVGGYYRPKQGAIRIKSHNDLEVTAHEVAHWMDEKYPWIKRLYKQYPQEMAGVSYDADLDFEGYAEFMRLFMTQEQEAIQRAPGFYDAWMGELNKPGREKLRNALFDTQELMHAWHLQGWRKRMVSKVGDDGLNISQRTKLAMTGGLDKSLQKTFDQLHSIKIAETEIRGGTQDATISPYKSFRLAAGHMGVTKAVMHYGTIEWNEAGDIEFNGKSIRDIFAPVEDQMEDMQLYMVARRAQELDEQGRENLFRPDEYLPALQLGDRNPAIKKAFEEWLEFNTRMLDFYQQSGLISDTQRKAIEEMNKNYVPFNRIVETASELGRGNKSHVAKSGSPFMRLKGGSANINDVFDNILNNTSMMIHMSLLNRGKQQLYNMIDNADNQMGGQYAEKIPTDSKKINIDNEQVKKAFVQGMGLTWGEFRKMEAMPKNEEEVQMINFINDTFAEMGDFVSFWQFGIDPKGDVDFVFRDGKKEFYEIVDPMLYESIQLLGPQSHNWAVSVLGGFSNMLRRGVTSTPVFQAKNFIRDTMNAFTLSRGRMVPAVDAMKAVFQRIHDDPVYWDYMVNGGGFATMAEADGINADRIMDPRSFLSKYDEIIGSMETANRLAEYKAMLKQGSSKREAAFAGREISTDFAMRGSSQALRVITISIPFMNARMQGHYRIAREVGQRQPNGKFRFDPSGTYNYALRATLGIMLPSLVLYMLNRDDDRYLELPDYVKDLSWFIPTGTGEDDYILIPKPFETGMLWGSVPERMMANLRGEEHGEELTDAMLWMAMETFGIDFVAQAYKPWDDLRRNKSFTGAPIIPEYMQHIEPAEQYRAYTSDSMIALGRAMNISPIKAEYLVRGYFGTLGTWALGAADYVVGDMSEGGQRVATDWEDNVLLSPFVNDGPLKRTKSESKVYDMLKETRIVTNTIRDMTRRSPERLEEYINSDDHKAIYATNKMLERQSKVLRELRNTQDVIRYSKDLTGEEKRDKLHEIQRVINKVTRATAQSIDFDEMEKLIESAPQED